MSLVQPSTLATRLQISAQDAKIPGALALAESMIAAYLGTDTLEQASRSQKIRPVRDRDSIEIAYGPMTSLTSLSVDGTAQTVGDFLAGYWGITITDPSLKFSAYRTVDVAYTSGWANEAALPVPIREAILIVGQQAFALDPTGRQLTSRSIGDFSESWAADPNGSSISALSSSAVSLLSRYRRPQL